MKLDTGCFLIYMLGMIVGTTMPGPEIPWIPIIGGAVAMVLLKNAIKL